MKNLKGLALESNEKIEERHLAEVIVQRIEQLLNKRHISKYRLSQLTEIERPSLTSLFDGTYAPSMSTLNRICDALNVSYEELFNLDNDNDKSVSVKDKRLLKEWHKLNYEQKRLLLEFASDLANENK